MKTALAHGREVAAERRAIAAARLIICNSRRTRDDVVRHTGVDAARTRIVYYGVDAERFPAVTAEEKLAARRRFGWAFERPLVAFVGALGDRRKAFDTVFAAWARLCAVRDWDADLVVAGAGAEQRLWKERARQLGCASRIHFMGFRSDVPQVLAAADALVHPARYEPYGLSVREALCRGLPAFVTATAGVAEELPASLSDLLIGNPDDALELEARLRAWRGDRRRLEAAVKPVAERLRARTWDRMAEEIVAAAGELQPL